MIYHVYSAASAAPTPPYAQNLNLNKVQTRQGQSQSILLINYIVQDTAGTSDPACLKVSTQQDRTPCGKINSRALPSSWKRPNPVTYKDILWSTSVTDQSELDLQPVLQNVLTTSLPVTFISSAAQTVCTTGEVFSRHMMLEGD